MKRQRIRPEKIVRRVVSRTMLAREIREMTVLDDGHVGSVKTAPLVEYNADAYNGKVCPPEKRGTKYEEFATCYRYASESVSVVCWGSNALEKTYSMLPLFAWVKYPCKRDVKDQQRRESSADSVKDQKGQKQPYIIRLSIRSSREMNGKTEKIAHPTTDDWKELGRTLTLTKSVKVVFPVNGTGSNTGTHLRPSSVVGIPRKSNAEVKPVILPDLVDQKPKVDKGGRNVDNLRQRDWERFQAKYLCWHSLFPCDVDVHSKRR